MSAAAPRLSPLLLRTIVDVEVMPTEPNATYESVYIETPKRLRPAMRGQGQSCAWPGGHSLAGLALEIRSYSNRKWGLL